MYITIKINNDQKKQISQINNAHAPPWHDDRWF